MKRALALAVAALLAVGPVAADDSPTVNQKDIGYRGIWYFNQESGDEYVYKYSGGLGTYCAKHNPFAVYCPQVEKTFFCYGGTSTTSHRQLLHMVSSFDHRTRHVPRPTILLDKKTNDAHDNPVMSVDDDGYIWIFSTSHGRSRPSYIHRSTEPYNVQRFERVDATYETPDGPKPLTNFSYMQAWHRPGRGFICFFTRYGDPAKRTNMFMTSRDGVTWSAWQRLAAIEEGHYQISAVNETTAASAFNFHPQGQGLNRRTNLYYVQTADGGESWQSAAGQPLTLPLTDPQNAAMVHDYRSEQLNVYLKDMPFDGDGRPVILFITSPGYAAGPKNDPRRWNTARWDGSNWDIRPITTSDNNYDMGSLFIELDGTWRIIAPTTPGLQKYNPGGEVVMWVSRDRGENWKQMKALTSDSRHNHTYVRRPVNAHQGFYAIWADGHGREPSPSRIYFCDREGNVFVLPREMMGEFASPTLVISSRP